MSRTKARTISSLRMRRCSQRRKRTNCTPTGTRAVRMVDQWMGMGVLSEVKEVDEVEEVKEKNAPVGTRTSQRDSSSGLRFLCFLYVIYFLYLASFITVGCR